LIPKSFRNPYVLSLALAVLATVVAWFAQAVVPARDLSMFYLLAVVIAALFWGKGPAIAASITCVLLYDFFFVPPRFSLMAFSHKDWIPLGVFLVVGLIISNLTARVRASTLAAEKEKLLSLLLSSVSHDLRTPLVSITGTLSRLLEHTALDEDTRRELIETAYEESERLNHLVGNLLDMTRVESGALKISPRPCEVRDLIGVSLQQFSKQQLNGRNIRIQVAEDLPEVSMDYALMMKVLGNVIENALKYSPPGSPLEIRASRARDRLLFEILDQGFGIPDKERARIFEKFYRVQGPRKIPGTGLGLSICKGIVEAHGGMMWAEKNSPEGTKVVITLPWKVEEDA
jgi:two-component system sensor histidine kinase KdpD